MREVVVHTVRLSLGRRDGNSLRRSIVEQSGTAREGIEEGWHPPWSNDFDFGINGEES